MVLWYLLWIVLFIVLWGFNPTINCYLKKGHLNYCHQSDCVPYVQLPFAFVEKRNSEVTWCSWYLLYDFCKTDNADMINSDNWITTMLKIQ